MPRRALEVRVQEDARLYARYQGLFDRHVEISTGALRAWHQPVIDAVMSHELGHYQLYHAEQQAVALMLLVGLVVLNPWGIVAVWPLHLLWRWLLEIQADRFSQRRGFDMLWAIDEHLALRLSPLMRLQLRIRRKCLEAI